MAHLEKSNEKQTITLEDLKEEIEKSRKGSWKKDLTIAIVPLLVAVLSIYFSNRTVQRQLKQSSGIESAKLIANFSDDIIKGGKEREIAAIAFESVPLLESQRNAISNYLEEKSGGSDAPPEDKKPPLPTEIKTDPAFDAMLVRLFDDQKTIRSKAYGETKSYLTQHNDPILIKQMGSMVEKNPFNIKGRSNVLSILASSPKDILNTQKDYILEQLKRIENLKDISPAYAVGPQTTGWIAEIRVKLK